MARLNVAKKEVTHEGAPAYQINPTLQLRRTVMSCMLWEKGFYEDGETVADRIAKLIPLCEPQAVAAIALEARTQMKLRHVPLLIAREMARLPKHKALVANTLSGIIQRPDELTEFLAIYWKDKRQTLSAQVKKGLARALLKFNEYSLAKYNRDGAVKLRDVLFLTHAKPHNEEQATLFKKLVDGTLATPDTWEVELSASKDKKASWERLLSENKLGALALLRNLRNMQEAGINESLIRTKISEMKTERVLPFRFIAAGKHAPMLEDALEPAMLTCLESHKKLLGKTILLVDVSGSMEYQLSGKSEMTRMEAACALAMLVREICEQVAIVTFSNQAVQVPPRRGFALRDAITKSQSHQGTYLGKTIEAVNINTYDRLIVITDEQSHDSVPAPKGKGYMINVATNKNGVGYGPWTHIDGFSESVIDYIQQIENEN